MKIFAGIVRSTLFIMTPALIAFPAHELPWNVVQQVNYQPIQVPNLRTLSYDEVLDFLSKIESDSFNERYSEDLLDQINQFVSHLAMEGATSEEKLEIGYAVASLFRKDSIQYTVFNSSIQYNIKPAIFIKNSQDFVLCKSWAKKQWDQTKSFVKKNKKVIIIGAIVVVAVAVVAVAAVAVSASASAAAAAAGGAIIGGEDSTSSSEGSSNSTNEGKVYSEPKETTSNESLVSLLQTQVAEFKETIAQEQFSVISESNTISIEENGRIIGSLFTHKTIDSLINGLAHNPMLATELKDFGFNSQYAIPEWLQIYPDNSTITPHLSADFAFSTNYTTFYRDNFGDLNAFIYQVRGDLALNSECYAQAVQDFEKAISINPTNPTLYLEKGIANFELGNYEQSIVDYNQFVEKKAESFSVTDFSLGFAKGVPKGAYESGKGALLFLADFVAHPVYTSKQVIDSISQLASLVKNDEFGVVAEILSPELHQLVTHWNNLPSVTKGELAGYAVGKLGTDLFAPGAVAKIASKSVDSAKKLVEVCKNLQIAQETLILETAAGIGIPTKVAEIVEMGKKTLSLGEELGFTNQEMGQLQKGRSLETAVSRAFENLTPLEKEYFELFDKAQKFLKPYKEFMSESQARDLIEKTGIKTFPRPLGIPENFRVQISDKGAGIKYVHPTDAGTYIRVMPGKPHSPFLYQQKPYISHLKNGNFLDKNGNVISRKDPAAHIPVEEFIYRE